LGAAAAGAVGFGPGCLAGARFGAAFVTAAASAAAFGAADLGAGVFGFGAAATFAPGDGLVAAKLAVAGFDLAAGSGLDRPAPDEAGAERSFELLPPAATTRPWRAAWLPASAS
jgi:hypothetical protein